MMASRQRGFTLIELVVVITILGILAAFAVPKFISLTTQARIASLNGLAGSMKSAASLARGMAMVTGVAATGTVTMEGAVVTLVQYYPDSITGIQLAVNANTGTQASGADFTSVPGTTGTTVATYESNTASPVAATCAVTYLPATATSPPVVTVVSSTC